MDKKILKSLPLDCDSAFFVSETYLNNIEAFVACVSSDMLMQSCQSCDSNGKRLALENTQVLLLI